MNLKYYLRGLGIGILVTAVIMLFLAQQNKNSLSDKEIKERAAALGMVESGSTLDALKEDEKDIEAVDSDMSESFEGNTDEVAAEETEAEEIENKEAEEIKAEEIKTEEITANENETSDNKAEETKVEETNTKESKENANVKDNHNDDYLDDIEATIDEADAYLENKTSDSNNTNNDASKNKKVEQNSTDNNSKTSDNKQEDTKSNTQNENKNKQDSVSLTIRSGESSYVVAKHLQELGLISDANSFDNYLCSTGKDRRIRVGTYDIPSNSSTEEIANFFA